MLWRCVDSFAVGDMPGVCSVPCHKYACVGVWCVHECVSYRWHTCSYGLGFCAKRYEFVRIFPNLSKKNTSRLGFDYFATRSNFKPGGNSSKQLKVSWSFSKETT